MWQEKTAERTSRAREQLLAARLRQEKLAEARRTVAALQSALEAGQTQVSLQMPFVTYMLCCTIQSDVQQVPMQS